MGFTQAQEFPLVDQDLPEARIRRTRIILVRRRRLTQRKHMAKRHENGCADE